MGELKVNGTALVNSTAIFQTARMPASGVLAGNYGNATHSATITVGSNGMVNAVSNNDLSTTLTSRNFEAASNNDGSYVVYVSTSAPTGGANGDIWYQVYS
jgi:hypothetical protein